jgi:hypothetical protein
MTTTDSKASGLAVLLGFCFWSAADASSYRDQFRANYQRACVGASVTGPDAIPLKIAEAICQCTAYELTDTESDAILKLFEAQPTAFEEIFRAAGDKCAQQVLNRELPPVGSGPQSFKCKTPDGTVEYSAQPCPNQALDTSKWGGSPEPSANDPLSQERETSRYRGERLSVNYEDTGVREIMQVLSQFTELRFVVSDQVSYERFSVHYNNIPWDQLLDLMVKKFGLAGEDRGGYFYIAYPLELEFARILGR